MNYFSSLLSFIISVLSISYAGINVLDVLIFGVILFYSYEGYMLGLWFAGLDFICFIISFLLGLIFFSQVSSVLVSLFALPQGFANAIAFFLVAFLSEIILAVVSRKTINKLPEFSKKNPLTRFLTSINHPLGIIPGLASSYIILSFLLTIIIALPSSPALKQLVTDSKFGETLVSHTVSVQHSLQSVFGGAINDTLNVMTVKPESGESISLHFTVADPVVDEAAEAQMFNLVNHERTSRGLSALKADSSLLILARAYASQMFSQGYFSHFTPSGKSPFDRMNDAGIIYNHAGENLALAPGTDLAHQGLMNSPGHKANILSPDYKKVGIGVVDGGIYGKMYVQEFTD